jgi:hypothetical protein
VCHRLFLSAFVLSVNENPVRWDLDALLRVPELSRAPFPLRDIRKVCHLFLAPAVSGHICSSSSCCHGGMVSAAWLLCIPPVNNTKHERPASAANQ